MKIQEMKRYILWLISLVVALVFFAVIASTQMIPGKYLILLGLAFLVVYAILFAIQLKWGKVRFAVSALIEILLAVVCVFGISALSQATQMMEEITEPTTESELISIYVLADSSYESAIDAVDDIWGRANNQSLEAVDSFISRLSKEWNKEIKVEGFADMFQAADALKAGQIQVLILNEAFAGLIPEVEGYEWFSADVKVLESSKEEVVVKEPAEEEDKNDSQETGSKDETGQEDKEDKTEDPVVMELMETPEQVDWNSLVNQEMLTAPDGTFVAYISGADTWGSAGTKSKSDVNILAVVNTASKKVLLVSTPRDYYVPMAVSNGVKDKLTHAGIYGINNSVETLEMLYGVDIQYYVRVNFTGFVGIVDALGGIDVYSDATFSVGDAFFYQEGINHMSGIEALAFARERYVFAGGDRARGNHQMEVIKAVLQKCISPSIISNYSNVMNSMSGCFTTDMPQDKIASLVRMQLNDMATWDITSMSVDGTGASKTTYTMPGQTSYVMVPDETSVQTAKNSIAAVLQ